MKPLIEELIASSLQQSPELHVHMLAAECVRRGRGSMKPHTFAEMVNKVRDLAFDFGTTEQFRDRVAALLGEYVPVDDESGREVVQQDVFWIKTPSRPIFTWYKLSNGGRVKLGCREIVFLPAGVQAEIDPDQSETTTNETSKA